MGKLAVPIFLCFVLWLFTRDFKGRKGVSPALWIVFIWVVIISSRAVSTWFEVGREVAVSDDYDQGNPFERNIYFVLLVSGWLVLSKRGLTVQSFIQANPWLSVFSAYWLVSVVWADLPFVAFKRWVKDSGNLVMVLVLLSERDPSAATKALFVRCAALLVPFSVLFIRYFPDLGRAYHQGEMMFTGVAAHKNTLGALVMVSALFLVWELVGPGGMRIPRRFKDLLRHRIPELILLGVTLWLLVKSHSATALACTVVGLTILVVLRFSGVRLFIPKLEIWVLLGVFVAWLSNSVFDIQRFVIQDILGRDMTLTTRTEVWPVLLAEADSALLGSGFMSFWSGDRLADLLERYSIIQAHNGYLEVYLNGGIVAITLLITLLITRLQGLKRAILTGDDFAMVKLACLSIAIIHNFTEASISKGGLVWFILLLALVVWPTKADKLVQPRSSKDNQGENVPALRSI